MLLLLVIYLTANQSGSAGMYGVSWCPYIIIYGHVYKGWIPNWASSISGKFVIEKFHSSSSILYLWDIYGIKYTNTTLVKRPVHKIVRFIDNDEPCHILSCPSVYGLHICIYMHTYICTFIHMHTHIFSEKTAELIYSSVPNVEEHYIKACNFTSSCFYMFRIWYAHGISNTEHMMKTRHQITSFYIMFFGVFNWI